MTVERPDRAMFIVIMLLIISQLGETIYLPATPAMTFALNTTPGNVQFILAIFLTAFGSSMFIWGPFSEYYGRRPIAIVSIIMQIIASLFCAMTNNIYVLWLCVFVLGVGMSTGGLLCRTVSRDLYSGHKLLKATSWIGIALVTTPILAPFIGANILEFANWRAIFLFPALCCTLMLIWTFFCLEETNPFVKKTHLNLVASLRNYWLVLKEPRFIGNTLCVSLNVSSCFGYEVAAPFLLQQELGLSPVIYSIVVIIPIAGFLFGSFISSHVSRYLLRFQVTGLGIFLAIFSSILMLVWECVFGLSFYSLLIPMTLYLLGSGLLFPTSTTGALMPFARGAGLAGATLGGIQNLTSGLFVFVVGSLSITSGIPLATSLLVLSLLCLLSLVVFIIPFERHLVGEE